MYAESFVSRATWRRITISGASSTLNSKSRKYLSLPVQPATIGNNMQAQKRMNRKGRILIDKRVNRYINFTRVVWQLLDRTDGISGKISFNMCATSFIKKIYGILYPLDIVNYSSLNHR